MALLVGICEGVSVTRDGSVNDQDEGAVMVDGWEGKSSKCRSSLEEGRLRLIYSGERERVRVTTAE